MDLSDVWVGIVYPAVLFCLALLVPSKVKQRYVWLAIAFVLTTGLLCTLGAIRGLRAVVLAFVVLAALLALHGMLSRVLGSIWRRYRRLVQLQELIGAIDWGATRAENVDTVRALQAVETSLAFMGFGFSKFLKASKDGQVPDNPPDLKDTLLFGKLTELLDKPSSTPVRILLMHPHAEDVDTHHRAQDESYPSVTRPLAICRTRCQLIGCSARTLCSMPRVHSLHPCGGLRRFGDPNGYKW